jgi:sugar-specific transcriptional regulator TrmB
LLLSEKVVNHTIMTLETVLEELGLKKNKAKVYLASLELGAASGADIAHRARLPRTTTLEILEFLTSQGLLGYVNEGRTRIYSAEPPEKLRTLLKEKERALQSVLPELRSRVHTRGARPRVQMFDGVEGVKTVFEDTLTTSSKQLDGILSMQDLYKTPGKQYMDDYVKRRIGAGIRLRVIRSQMKEVEETWPTSQVEARELRYGPAEYLFPMTMYFYDRKVGIIGTERESFGMIIESEEFFQTQKNLFELLWDVSRISQTKQ